MKTEDMEIGWAVVAGWMALMQGQDSDEGVVESATEGGGVDGRLWGGGGSGGN